MTPFSDGVFASVIGAEKKSKASLVPCARRVDLAFARAEAEMALYALVALMWLIPDWRIEQRVEAEPDQR